MEKIFTCICGIILLTAVFANAQSFACYVCQYPGHGEACINNPANVTQAPVTCPPGAWCFIQRMAYVATPNQVYSLFRSCSPTFKNETDDQNVQYITYFTSCNKDFCNSGNGLRNDKPGGGGGGGGEAIASSFWMIIAVISSFQFYAYYFQ